MTVTEILQNLDNTIAGKEGMLYDVQRERTMVGLRDGEGTVLQTIAQYLTINIDELKRIREDVAKINLQSNQEVV